MASAGQLTGVVPYDLSSALGTHGYANTGILYDVAFDAIPFIANSQDQTPYNRTPYHRQTAPYKKDQLDIGKEPGEQSITGWWVRAQSSFHCGSGIKFYDPDPGEIVDYRITDSQGADIWTKGQVTLLNAVTAGHTIADVLASNGRPIQISRSVVWGTSPVIKGVLLSDYDEIDKIDNAGTVTDFKNTTGQPIYALCDDGNNAYWITNAGGKAVLMKKPLSGSSASTADETTMATHATIAATNAVIEYVQERLVVCVNNNIYEMTPLSASFPTPLYTHPDPTYVYTDVTASGYGIYVSGYNVTKSSIVKFVLNTSGVMPTLTSAITAAEMPPGEIIFSMYYDLGLLMIGTNKGIRAADASATDGSLIYGPLIVATTQPCYAFAGRDHYVWCATGVAGAPGVIRLDLGQQISIYRYAYANDAMDTSGTTGHPTTSVAFFGNTSPTDVPQLSFTTIHANGVDGNHYIQSTTTKVPTGYVTTGALRYSTLEQKVFKTVRARVDNTYGSLKIESIDKPGNIYTIANFGAGDFTPEASITYPTGAQEYVSFKFTLSRYASDSTLGPVFTGYQVKSLPAIERQRMITYPVLCYDRDEDHMGNVTGYEGMAWAKLQALEAKEALGDTVKVIDFRTNESYIGVIEDLTFEVNTPVGKKNPAFGGTLQVTVRKF